MINWFLAFVAAVLWVLAYCWYFQTDLKRLWVRLRTGEKQAGDHY